MTEEERAGHSLTVDDISDEDMVGTTVLVRVPPARHLAHLTTLCRELNRRQSRTTKRSASFKCVYSPNFVHS